MSEEEAASDVFTTNNPMLEIELNNFRSNSSSNTRISTLSPPQPDKLVARVWLRLLSFLQFAGLCVSSTYLLPFSDVYKVTIKSVCNTLMPFQLLFLEVIFSLATDSRRLVFAHLSIVEVTILQRAYMNMDSGSYLEALFVLVIGVILFPLATNATKLSYRTSEKLKRSELTTFKLTTVPAVCSSTILSMLYVAGESFGCLFEYHSNPKNCGDIVYNNEMMMMILLTTSYIKIFIVPNLERTYTTGDLMRFNLANGREQTQLIVFVLAAAATIGFCATSMVLEDKGDIDGDILIVHNTTVQVMTADELEARTVSSYFVIVLIAIVPLIQLVPKNMFKRFHERWRTELQGRIAPFYEIMLVVVAFATMTMSATYFYISSTAEDVRYAEKWRIHSSDLIPIFLIVITFIFFANPNANQHKIRDSICLSQVPIIFVLQAYGNHRHANIPSIGDGEKENILYRRDANIFFGVCSLFLSYLWKLGRDILASWGKETGIQVIDEHLQKSFSIVVSVFPTLLFLYCEPQSCVMYSATDGTESYTVDECYRLQRANYAISAHIAFAVNFYIIFGYKLQTMSAAGLLSLRDIELHTFVQLICGHICTVAALVFFGIRNSERYRYGVRDGKLLSSVDKFIAFSSYMYGLIFVCWIIVYVAQFGREMRVKEEATFHEKETDEQIYTSCLNRINHWLNERLRKFLARFEIQENEEVVSEEEASIARPFRYILVMTMMPFPLLVFGGPILCFGFGLSIASVYVIRNTASSIFLVYNLFHVTLMMTDLRRAKGRKLELFFSAVSLVHIFPYTELWMGEVLLTTRINNGIIFVVMSAFLVILYKCKTLTLREAGVKTRRKHIRKVFVGATLAFVPSIVLASERIGCLVLFKDDVTSEGFRRLSDPYCGNIYLGTQAIMSMMVFLFAYSSSFLVEQRSLVTVKSVVTLQLSKIDLSQVVLLGIAVMIAIFLYGVREEGELRDKFNYFLLAVYLLVLMVAVLAFVGNWIKSKAEEKETTRDCSSLDEKISNLSQSSKNLFGVKNNRRSVTEEKDDEKVDEKEVFSTAMINLNPGV